MLPTEPSKTILEKEFDTSNAYFAHVESKLLNIVTLYLTVILAVVTGIYYIAGSDMFAKMKFWQVTGPRAFFMGLVAVVFSLIGTFLLGMFTELRTRKILVLEDIAGLRGHYLQAGALAGKPTGDVIRLVSSVVKCPPYLRRPSEDWYTALLVVFVNAVSLAFAVGAEFYAFATNLIKGNGRGQGGLFLVCLIVFSGVAFIQFRWVTVFCYLLDCRREKEHGPSQYELLPKHRSAYPPGLRCLSEIAEWIEKRERPAILKALEPTPGAR